MGAVSGYILAKLVCSITLQPAPALNFLYFPNYSNFSKILNILYFLNSGVRLKIKTTVRLNTGGKFTPYFWHYPTQKNANGFYIRNNTPILALAAV